MDLSCLAEMIRSNYQDADTLVTKVQHVFVRNTRRKRLFQERTGLALPPRTFITRWNTWLEACFYYAEHFDAIVQFFVFLNNGEETTQLSSIEVLLDCPSLALQLEFIGTIFRIVCESINQLQGRIELVRAVAINNRLRNQLNLEP